jgi:hypothetical protein
MLHDLDCPEDPAMAWPDVPPLNTRTTNSTEIIPKVLREPLTEDERASLQKEHALVSKYPFFES